MLMISLDDNLAAALFEMLKRPTYDRDARAGYFIPANDAVTLRMALGNALEGKRGSSH